MNQLIYFFIVALWVGGVVAYIIYLRQQLSRRKKEEAVEQEKRKRHRGKKCPQCHNIISAKREVCQHCGYRFSEIEIEEAVAKESHHNQHHRHSSGSGRKKRRGKKCPQCHTVVNYYREECQHCGYKFNGEPLDSSENEHAANNPESGS